VAFVKEPRKRYLLFYALLGSFFIHALALTGLKAYGGSFTPTVLIPKPTVELMRPVERFSEPAASPGSAAPPAEAAPLKKEDGQANEEAAWKEGEKRELEQFKTAAEKKLFLTYYELLSLSIRHNVVYPREAIQKGERGIAYLVFTLERTGELRDLVLRKGTGSKLLDEASLRAVRLSAPFAPFPAGLKQERIHFYLPIQFKKND